MEEKRSLGRERAAGGLGVGWGEKQVRKSVSQQLEWGLGVLRDGR